MSSPGISLSVTLSGIAAFRYVVSTKLFWAMPGFGSLLWGLADAVSSCLKRTMMIV